nr:subtilisin-like protease SBT5.6 [Ipomoea batatas]
MKNYSFIVLLLVILNVLAASSAERKLYVVYLGEHSGGKSFQEIEDYHCSFLHSVKGSTEEAKASLVHSYKNVINGFSALLTTEEADRISGVWPESPSFSEEDMEPVPLSWKGICKEGHAFNSSHCNR